MDSMSRSYDASSRAVTRWLVKRVITEMRRSEAAFIARLRAEQEERDQPRR
ncbi:hypothetical protein ACIBCS_27835 [Streptomyces phaeochromogenes]|uniref:hypothetical protein n=1 Tax=Streptomyces phaeochromogenes TaxID=1923 RepID=UPI0033D46F79